MKDQIAERLTGLSPEARRQLLAQILQEKAQKTETKAQAAPPMPRIVPLSFAQERLWFLDQLVPGSAAYNLRTAVRLTGQLNREALKRSLHQIVQRHDTFRTTLQEREGQVVQVIAPTGAIDLSIIDVQNHTPTEQEAAINRLAAAEAQRPFNLAEGPLLRTTLLQAGPQTHVLLATMHHTISDGWSIGLFIKELALLYRAFCAHQPSPLLPLPVQYGDFAIWQREWMRGPVLQEQIDYWQQKLSGDLPALALPTDHPRPPVQTFRGTRQSFALPLELAQSLKALCQEEGCTLFMLLLAAFKTLLYRYSGQEDILVGSPIAGRNRDKIDDLIGLFINTLVMRTDLSGDPSFRTLLQRVRETAVGAYAHQDLPFEKLVEILQPTRDASRSPLFQAMFIWQNAPMETITLPDLTLSLLKPDKGTSQFDLTLTMWDVAQGLTGYLEYNLDLFDDDTISRLISHFQVLITTIARHPDQPISQLALLSPEEQQQLTAVWNDTALPVPQDQSLPTLFAAQADRTPQVVALRYQEQKLTYQELNERANHLAHSLRQMGAGPGSFVGVCVDRSPEMMIAVLGVLKAGAAYVPLDPTYPSERLAFMVQDAAITIILTQSHLRPDLKTIMGQRQFVCLDAAGEARAAAAPAATAVIQPDDLAYVIYTSGSTGKPKGVQIRHRTLVNFLFAMRQQLQPTAADRLLAVTTLSFDIAALELYLPLIVGAEVVLASQETVADGLQLAQLLTQSAATLMQATPATWRLLLAAGWTGQPGLKILCGGEALPLELARQLLERGAVVWNLYGPTETTIWSMAQQVTDRDVAVPSLSGMVSIGRPLANTQVYVLDRHLCPLPVGVIGELYIGGEGLARGYLHRPDLTTERFIPDPFRPAGERLYRTGDLARYLPDGRLEFMGRIDHQVKVRGFRIELGEIEAALDQHPTVRQAIVTARADGREAEKRLVAYLVPDQEPLPDTSEWRHFLQAHLPAYMIPTIFITLPDLPLTPNGKVDRRALPAPETARPEMAAAFVAPRTPIEEQLAHIWLELLPVERIGVHDNFFDLGGYSLLATQIISRVRQQFAVEAPLRRFFESPTLADLALVIAQLQETETGEHLTQEIVQIHQNRQGNTFPLSFAQQRLWFLDKLEPGSAVYNIPLAMRLTGQLNVAVLARSLTEIQRRHEVLRTTFAMGEQGEPVQVIAPPTPVTLSPLDLSQSPDQEAAVQQLAQAEAQRPFDLAAGPLFRAKLLHLGEQDHVLLLTMHHIISDGWSLNLLIQELIQLYQAFPLPDLPVQYADFAVWQRDWLQGETLAEQLAYWQGHLAGAPTLLTLPTDYPRPALQTFRGAKQPFRLPPALSAGLKQVSRQEGVTLFVTLLAAFQVLLARYSGQTDIVVGSPIAGRNRLETEKLIGFFVNTLALRADLSGNPSFRTLLSQVRETVWGAQAHQDVPFEKLVDELKLERNLSHAPLFQVMIILQNALAESSHLPGLTVTPIRADNETAKFDLTLAVVEGQDVLHGVMEYNTDLFTAATVRQMLTHWQTLLQGIVADPGHSLADLPLLTAVEQQKITVAWNQTAADIPPHQGVHHFFSHQAQQTPQAPAAIFADETLTYQELDQRSNQLAHYLRQLGVGPETCVGLCVERSLTMLVGLLGILKAGGAYIPLDPTYPPERLAYMLADAQATVLLTQQPIMEQGVWTEETLGGVQTVCLDSDWSAVAQQSAATPTAVTQPHHLAYVIYTSGSTGKPKGVQISHGALVNFLFALQQQLNLAPRDKWLAVTTISFDIAGLELYLPLMVGAAIVLASRETAASGEQLIQLQQQSAATFMQATPATWHLLLASGWEPEAPLNVLCGGEAMPGDLAHALQAQGHTVYNLYGPTETTIWSAAHRLTAAVAAPETADSVVSIGQPIANTQLYILDAHLRPVPIGAAGELYIGGAGLARGYRYRPALTADRFIPNPFNQQPAASRLYRTGDLARFLPDGRIAYLGRIDQQVKVRGFRIELGEIEAVLSQHPLVQQTAVLVREDVPGDKRLVAYLVAQAGAERPLADNLRPFLQEKLPAYMIPTAFVTLDAFPLTHNGKLNRRALPPPEITDTARRHTLIAPRTDIEQTLATVWQEVLRLKQVGIHDNFFELGGHSLLVVQVHTRLQQVLPHPLSMIDLFKYPTIGSLAQYLTQGQNRNALPQRSEARVKKMTQGNTRLKQLRKKGRQRR